jgi:hypothetical protein
MQPAICALAVVVTVELLRTSVLPQQALEGLAFLRQQPKSWPLVLQMVRRTAEAGLHKGKAH